MKIQVISLAAAASLGLACCAGGQAGMGGARAPGATATLVDAAGQTRARASFTDTQDGIRVSVVAVHMAPGAYGAHVHAVGRCDAPDFTSAGPHWNPTGRSHGKENPNGYHKGDLPNLIVGADGRGSMELTIPDAGLRNGAMRILDDDGAAMVIHAGADDYRTDPSGNSGSRLACGVIG
jgi:Cu-Zn family superoxide dismutase